MMWNLPKILAEIRDFDPADRKEANDLRNLLTLLERSDSCCSRTHYDPGHLTASAFIIHPPTKRLLLHHHRKLGRWLQMGGHLEEGESPAEAALRESKEESGLKDLTIFGGVFDLDVHEIPARGTEPAHLHFDLRYAALTAHPESASHDPNESVELRWFPFHQARPRMDQDCAERVLRRLDQIVVGLSLPMNRIECRGDGRG